MMCKHEWTTHELSKRYVWLSCDLCGGNVTITGEAITYDFDDDAGNTSWWGKYFKTIKETYALADAILESM